MGNRELAGVVLMIASPWLLTACNDAGSSPFMAKGETASAQSLSQSRGEGEAIAEGKTRRGTSPKPEQTVVLGSPELTAGIPGEGPLTIDQIKAWLDDPRNHQPLKVELPLWLVPGAGQTKDLKENPMTRAKIELGRQLFFEKRLSADNTISCASCHEPEHGYTVTTAAGRPASAARREDGTRRRC
jgi:hypothetical protein